MRGFTLIELIIVIAIISIIGSFAVQIFSGESVYQPPPSGAVVVPSPVQ